MSEEPENRNKDDRPDRDPKSEGPRPGGTKPGGEPARPRLGRQLLMWIVVFTCVLALASLLQRSSTKKTKKVGFQKFMEYLDAGKIKDIEAKGNTVKATLVKAEKGIEELEFQVPPDYLGRNYEMLAKKVKGEIRYEGEGGMLLYILANSLPVILLFILLWYLINRQMRAMSASAENFPFAKSRVHSAHLEKTNVKFSDVAGIEEAKQEVKEIVDFLKAPEKYRRIGGRIPRGVLLVGHPGTGKTLLAKAIAGEASVPFFSLCGSDFVELFVGVGASRVRDLFKQARENPPCIIFLDEIDAVGRRRGTGLGGGHDEREQTLNAILSEMDGFKRDEGIIIIAATNRPDVLDPALLRPGRFDREIVVDLPDVKGREAILRVHARKVKLGDDIDLGVLARGTPGFSGAELEAIINEAAILAANRDKTRVAMADLEEARDKVRFGRQKISRVMSDEDRRVTAFHEAGHTLVAKLHPNMEPLHKVTIIPRGQALGMTMILPEKDRYNIRKGEAMGFIVLDMAGRIAEELCCDDISAGAQSDIEHATEMARRMVCRWGMSEKLGPLSYTGKEEHLFLGREVARTQDHSEATSQLIDEEVRGVIDSCYQQARQLLTVHKEDLERVANALLEYETLDAKDVDDLLAGRKITKTVVAEAKTLDQIEEEDRAAAEKEKAESDAESAAEGSETPEDGE